MDIAHASGDIKPFKRSESMVTHLLFADEKLVSELNRPPQKLEQYTGLT